MSSAWKYSTGDGTKVVAVIDTGIKEHQQINRALTRNADGTIYGYDFVSDIVALATAMVRIRTQTMRAVTRPAAIATTAPTWLESLRQSTILLEPQASPLV
jgi:hypothetical protein